MRGGRGPMRELTPATPGPTLTPADVTSYPNAPLYDTSVVRTLFFEFENKDWESELEDFNNTDVDVPATLTVDGKTYKDVGVHFRGASSYFMVPAGHKRSLNVSLDHAEKSQRLGGYKTLNLLNANGDPSFMSSVLYSAIANRYIPAPRANFVRVVINGECWGLYVNVQQFDAIFVNERFAQSAGETGKESKKKGARWKVPGSPNGAAGLDFIGESIDDYKRRYEIKTSDNDEDWIALRELCRTLSNTPIDELEGALKPILDIDGALWFLALDVSLGNSDGYWTRASDYSIYRDPKGMFHVIPHDMNEAFSDHGPPGGMRGPRSGRGRPVDGPPASPQDGSPGGGPGMRGPGGGAGGAELDPLVGGDDMRKPLRSRLLAVPALRAKYLEYVKTLAKDDLAWDRIGPQIAAHRALIEPIVKADTKKLSTTEAFERATADADGPAGGNAEGAGGLKSWTARRSAYLRDYKPAEKAATTSDAPAGGSGGGAGVRGPGERGAGR